MPRPKRTKVASTAARVAKPAKTAQLPTTRAPPKPRNSAVPQSVDLISEDSDGLVVKTMRTRRHAPAAELSQEEAELTMTGALPVASETDTSKKTRTPEAHANRRTRKSMGSAQGSSSRRSTRTTAPAESRSAEKETSFMAAEEEDSSGFGDHLLSFTSLGSDSPAHGTRPPSAIKVGATPAHERSILALTNFKRRPRQPSLLRMVHQTTDVEDNDHDELDFSDLEDFHPNAESTPLPKSQFTTGKEGATDSGVNLSSSGSRGTKRKLTSVVQVPRSSPPYDPPSGPDVESRSPSPSLPDFVRGTVEEKTQGEEDDAAEQTEQEIYSETMAPPMSSSDYQIDVVEEPQSSPARTRRPRGKTAVAHKDTEEMEGEETDRPVPSKGKRKPDREKAISTAKLQALLPKRRARTTRDDSDSASPIESDEDELSMPPRRHARLARKIAAQKSTKKLARGTKKTTTTSTNNTQKGNRTYGRRISSDKENEGRAEADGDSDDSGDTARETNNKPSSNLEAMAKKFADIDNFDLDFESVSYVQTSSSPGR